MTSRGLWLVSVSSCCWSWHTECGSTFRTKVIKMNKYWAYFQYILRHKWFVFLAGLKTGAPIWLLIIHDWSKFLPSEFFPYTDYFYNKEKQASEGLDAI